MTSVSLPQTQRQQNRVYLNGITATVCHPIPRLPPHPLLLVTENSSQYHMQETSGARIFCTAINRQNIRSASTGFDIEGP